MADTSATAFLQIVGLRLYASVFQGMAATVVTRTANRWKVTLFLSGEGFS
jgi:hypothetical protein